MAKPTAEERFFLIEQQLEAIAQRLNNSDTFGRASSNESHENRNNSGDPSPSGENADCTTSTTAQMLDLISQAATGQHALNVSMSDSNSRKAEEIIGTIMALHPLLSHDDVACIKSLMESPQ